MAWHGYALIEVSIILTAPQKQNIKTALLELGEQTGLPNIITHIRPRLDGQAVIIEVHKPAQITKAEIVQKIANATGYTVNQIDNNSTLTIFTGDNWLERGAACRQYLIDNITVWETVTT